MAVNGRILITGATGSMGAAAVEALASQGTPVLMACRNLKKADVVRKDILTRVPDADLEIRQLDLASLESVRRFAQDLEPGRVSALFHNAGVISKGYSLTCDGFENTFSVNYLGPWLLTRLLLPKLPEHARMVFMVSLTCRFASLKPGMLQPSPKDFTQLGTYASAKRALLSFSLELFRRYSGLQVHLADPGVVASDMIDLGHWYDPLADRFFKPLCKKPLDGVRPALRALATTQTESRFFVGKGDKPIPHRYVTPLQDARLWEETEQLLIQ